MNTKKLTRKHIANIIVCSIILLALIVAFICYVHEPRLIQDTNRKPDISFNGTTFDISAKDFVRIVNEDLDKEGLSLISEDYAKDQYGKNLTLIWWNTPARSIKSWNFTCFPFLNLVTGLP